MANYLYSDSFKNFINADSKAIFGELNDNYHGETTPQTKKAWKGEITLLKEVLAKWPSEKAQIIFEYNIPRLGKRIDVVLLLGGLIFCLEFKVSDKSDKIKLKAGINQVMDYALDLKYFHLHSHNKKIIPILIPTKYRTSKKEIDFSVYPDGIYKPLVSGGKDIQELIGKILKHAKVSVQSENDKDWISSRYSPTPTIIEAARVLYEKHTVKDILKQEADKDSTEQTTNYILEIIEKTKREQTKSICFVTGVPGAGKTLVGLNIAMKQSHLDKNNENKAVYLSGNGPLIAVLNEALLRDYKSKCKKQKINKDSEKKRNEVNNFIRIIHRYRDEMLGKIKITEKGNVEIDSSKATCNDNGSGYAEVEHIVIFDEAQRCWTQKRLANYLERGGTYGNKIQISNFPMSEAAFLIWSLDQRKDWAVIVCLVGGGQEINTGEAGISEWIESLNNRFKNWKIYISNKLTEPEYAEGLVTKKLKCNSNVCFSDKLHLTVSMRAFRASQPRQPSRTEAVSHFIHSLLSFNTDAGKLYKEIKKSEYSIMLTRDMDKARQWLRTNARGKQRSGILVTKSAARFKPLAVNLLAKGDKNVIHWFLEDETDTRSSNYLEDAATEIQVQGLELDYVCVLWDADMRCKNGTWTYHKFNGKNKWNLETNDENKKYMLNAYRVLLTRARQGLVICVPEGNSKITPEGFPEDPTRLPEFYNGTYEYLKLLGLDILDE